MPMRVEDLEMITYERLQCPACEGGGPFTMHRWTEFTVLADGDAAMTDEDVAWNPGDRARCDCGWSGTFDELAAFAGQ